MLPLVRSSGEANYQVYTGTIVSALGTAMEETNRDMLSQNGTEVVMTHTPTITDIGDEYEGFTEHFGAGHKIGGASWSDHEIMLPPSALVFINTVSEAADNHVNVSPDWYEDNAGRP